MNDPPQGRVAGWSLDENLAFDIGFALPRSPIKGLRRALTEDERGNGKGDCRAPRTVRVEVSDDSARWAWDWRGSVKNKLDHRVAAMARPGAVLATARGAGCDLLPHPLPTKLPQSRHFQARHGTANQNLVKILAENAPASA